MTDPKGWIPYEYRSREGQRATDAWHEQIGTYGEAPIEELPKRALIHDLELKILGGKLLPRIWQTTGSCVGAGSGQAVAQAGVGDVAVRGDHETIQIGAWLVPYGEGRRIAGMGGRGSGSYGQAQAEAVAKFGLIPPALPKLTQPTSRDGWIKHPGNTELEWSYSPRWPVDKRELAPEAEKYQIGTVVRIKDTDQARQLAAQAYGITLASSFGIRGKPSVVEGVLLGRWTGSWAHQMSCGGYLQHDTLGCLWQINNQWGPQAHGRCPLMSQIGSGVFGSFFIEDDTFARIMSRGEVYAHSNTEGFPARPHVWDHGIAT